MPLAAVRPARSSPSQPTECGPASSGPNSMTRTRRPPASRITRLTSLGAASANLSVHVPGAGFGSTVTGCAFGAGGGSGGGGAGGGGGGGGGGGAGGGGPAPSSSSSTRSTAIPRLARSVRSVASAQKMMLMLTTDVSAIVHGYSG